MSLAQQMVFPADHPLAPEHTTTVSPVGELVPLMPTGTERDLPAQPVLYTAGTELDAIQLTQLVFDSRRRRPLIVLTRAQRSNKAPVSDPETLAADAWTIADTVLVSVEATQAFCALVPTWMHVFDSGIRIFLPGADLADDANTHPLILPEGRGVAKRAGKVMRTLRYATEKAQHTNPFRVVGDGGAETETKRQLKRVTAELAEARKQVAALTLDDDPVFSDPLAQFDHDLYNSYLKYVCEDDRNTYRLRPYTLSEDFLASIDELENIATDRIMRAIVDVVTKRYEDLPSREAHPLHGDRKDSGKGGTPIVRPSDGAVAWRAWISISGIGARIMWWECPGNEPELGRVAAHNDLYLKH